MVIVPSEFLHLSNKHLHAKFFRSITSEIFLLLIKIKDIKNNS